MGSRAALTIWFALACGQAGLPERSANVPGVFFPVMKPADAIPAALMPPGTLALRDGCLWLDTQLEGKTVSWLILWPAGSSLRQSNGNLAIHDDRGARVASVGERLEGGGGETRDLEHVRDLTGQTPPPECQVGEAYWRAYGVRAAH